MQDSWVCLGDTIHLYDDTNGSICVEGFTDVQLGFGADRIDGFNFGHHCCFRLMPQQMYTASKKLHAHDGLATGLVLDTARREAQAHRQTLGEEVRREKMHNESEVENSAGREVRYGKVLQLQRIDSATVEPVPSKRRSYHLIDDETVGTLTINYGVGGRCCLGKARLCVPPRV